MIKKPTLAQLIESAEKEVNADDWYRQNLLLEKFHGLSASSLNNYRKEMEGIPEFAEGVCKPGHSTTFIHYFTFLWYLRWKEANRYRTNQIPPLEILHKSVSR